MKFNMVETKLRRFIRKVINEAKQIPQSELDSITYWLQNIIDESTELLKEDVLTTDVLLERLNEIKSNITNIENELKIKTI